MGCFMPSSNCACASRIRAMIALMSSVVRPSGSRAKSSARSLIYDILEVQFFNDWDYLRRTLLNTSAMSMDQVPDDFRGANTRGIMFSEPLVVASVEIESVLTD